jgi:hypothetical protein
VGQTGRDRYFGRGQMVQQEAGQDHEHLQPVEAGDVVMQPRLQREPQRDERHDGQRHLEQDIEEEVHQQRTEP